MLRRWVEFLDKRQAKSVAGMLNGHEIGGTQLCALIRPRLAVSPVAAQLSCSPFSSACSITLEESRFKRPFLACHVFHCRCLPAPALGSLPPSATAGLRGEEALCVLLRLVESEVPSQVQMGPPDRRDWCGGALIVQAGAAEAALAMRLPPRIWRIVGRTLLNLEPDAWSCSHPAYDRSPVPSLM